MGIKRPRSGHDKAIVNVWQREVGLLSTRNFAHRLVASEVISQTLIFLFSLILFFLLQAIIFLGFLIFPLYVMVILVVKFC